jgi:N6-adenosine-specific RNA methylase IME4
MKGSPDNLNRGLDCDVIVAEVRATSHKPDEIYGIIERLSPGTRKIELFGRPHNVQPNWWVHRLCNKCLTSRINPSDGQEFLFFCLGLHWETRWMVSGWLILN